MASFRNGAYDAVVEALIAQRKARGMTLRQVASLMPQWLGFDFSTLHKIEKKRRDLSFVEGQELAKALGTSVGELDAAAAAIAAARGSRVRQNTTSRPQSKRPKRKGGNRRSRGE